ncbi:MAG: endonuclease domain-containing protein [Rhizobiaceae bacterium]
MTEEERKLWRHLWRIPTEGTHFRRQAPIGPYCADFLSHRLKLVIEIDGYQHGFEVQQRHDARRTAWLNRNGYKELRFWTHEVRKELDSVLNTIYAAVAERSAHLPLDGGGRREAAGGGAFDQSPHPGADAPTLPHKGRGRCRCCPIFFSNFAPRKSLPACSARPPAT